MTASTSKAEGGAVRLVRALRRAGVKHVFSLSGNHIMPVYDALLDAGIGLVHTRHEAAAVHMADAWGRLTGEPGVALVTGGPGHANAVGALYTAAMAESPLVLLSGHAPTAQLGQGAFQEMRQAAIAEPLAKASWTAGSAATLGAEFALAWQTARTGRPGPVHLSLPSDALEGSADAPAGDEGAEGGFAALPGRAPPAADAAALLAWLRTANYPLVLTGPLALTPNGRPAAAALEAALGVPVIGMESPRGTADPALGDLAAVLAEADAVLLVGKKLDFTLKFGRAFDAVCRFAQLDPEAAEIERARHALGARLEQAFEADTLPALRALAAVARGTPPHPASEWLAGVHEAIAWRAPGWAEARGSSGRLHPAQLCRALQPLLDRHPDAVLVSDGGEFGQWVQACLRAPRRLVNGVAGSIGSALPFALAARRVEPEAPVLAFSGDGSIGFHIAEIDTAVRHRLPLVMVVGNDARWNAEHQIQLREYGAARAFGCTLLPTRYDAVCTAFGGHGERVTEADELLPALGRALASGLPALVNVMIDPVPAPALKR